MAKPFDSANKELINPFPLAWLALGGLPAPAGKEAVKPCNVDLSGYSATADWVAQVTAPNPYTAHLEFQTGPGQSFEDRTLLHNVLAGRRYGRPVFTVVFQFRPAAQVGVAGGILEELGPDSRLEFRYRRVRVWELPVEPLLTGELGTVPLAPIAAVADPERELPDIYRRVWQRIEREAPPDQADNLWGMTYVLSGLRHPPQLIDVLMSGVHEMRDSATYQAIVAEGEAKGRVEEARIMLIRAAKGKLGPPDAEALAAVSAIADTPRLEAMVDRIWQASTWAELLSMES